MIFKIGDIGIIALATGIFIVPLWILFGRLAYKFSKLAEEVEEMNKKRKHKSKGV